MKFLFPIQFSYEAAALIVALLVCYYLLRRKTRNNTRMKVPQPSGSLPLIGHLHLMGELPHITLSKFADQYGPFFQINLGIHRALVISDAKTVEEFVGMGDKVFINKPQTTFVQHLCYNSALFAFSQYGTYWRDIRKIVATELLSNHRLEMLKNVRISGVRTAIKAMRDNYSGTELVDLKIWLNELSVNNIVRLIAGKSLREFYQGEEYDRCQKALRDFFELAAAFVPGDALPFLRWLDIGGYEKTMRNTQKQIDRVAQKWLEEHRRRRSSGFATENQDFMDDMLDIFETGQDKSSQFEADTIIKATSMAMILGGTDTTSVTLTWALSLLLNNKESMKKAQDELEKYVGRGRQVDESDIKNLIYLQAIVKETLRLYPAVPLPPREAMTDSTVNGYHIQAGTQLIMNLYKIHRDPQLWEDPLQFRPERFLTTHKDLDMRGKNFEFMPFGIGRRICPGISFALQSTQFTLAALLHGFDISAQSDQPVDMTEGFGLTNLKASPLEVMLKPRLPDNLY